MTTRYTPTCGAALCVAVHEQRRKNKWGRKRYAQGEEYAPDICRRCCHRKLTGDEIEAGLVNCQDCRTKAAQRTRRCRDPETAARRAAMATLDPKAGIRRSRKAVMRLLEAGRLRKKPSTKGRPRLKAIHPSADAVCLPIEEKSWPEPEQQFAQEPPWQEPQQQSYTFVVLPFRDRPWLHRRYEEL